MQSNDLIHELGQNFIEYSVAVNTDRAIPNAKDGLKPVAKRILYGAYATGRSSSKPHVKCARIVGDVMGSYHPHGDSSIYGALVRLAQDWVMRYPLIDFHGNLGNIGGDGPAAYRYTEARLSKMTEEGLLQGIKKENVQFVDNYDETTVEPLELPAIFPNLLCNPNTGIGVAMACNWLPHNLNEVAQAIFDYMDGKEPTLLGPDFPTGGVIINKNDLPTIIKNGHGSVKVRGRYKVEKQNLVFYEIPYGTTIEGLIKEIGEVCDTKEIEGIVDLRDESNKKGIRIVIQCGIGVNPESIAQKLFLKTNLQSSISYNQVALVDKTPTELGLKDCIKIYLQHNKECLKKETEFDYKKAQERKEIVEGLLKALEDIDNIIALIKASKSSADAKDQLMIKYKFSENQAKAIVNMRLGSLANLEKVELNDEFNGLKKDIEQYVLILQDEITQNLIIRDRLQNLVKKYGDDRRTGLMQIDVKPEEKEIAQVIPEDVVVILSQSGEIKRIPTKSFKVQRRRGAGVKSVDDAILDTISTNTIDTLMFFTSQGKMYRMLVDKVPVGNNTSKGIPLGTLIQLDAGEKVIAMTSLYRKSNAEYIVFFTKQGLIKKSLLSEYKSIKKSTGTAAIKLKKGDSIASVTFLNKEDVLVLTKKGMSIYFETASINPIGRVTSGVRAIKLAETDEVLVGLPIHNSNDKVAIITKSGTGKVMSLSNWSKQARGGKGVFYYRECEIAGAAMVDDNDNLLMIGESHSLCVSANEFPTLTREGTGNIMSKKPIHTMIKL